MHKVSKQMKINLEKSKDQDMQIADLDSKFGKEKKTVKDQSKQITDLDSKLEKEKKTVKDQTMQIADLDIKLEREKNTVKGQIMQIADLDSTLKKEKNTVKNQDMQINDLGSKMEKEKNTMKDLTIQITELDSKLEKEIKTAKEQIKQFADVNSKLEKEINTLKDQEAFSKKQGEEITALKQDNESLQSKEQTILFVGQCKSMKEKNDKLAEDLTKEMEKHKVQEEEDKPMLIEKGLEAENEEQDIETVAQEQDKESLQSKSQTVMPVDQCKEMKVENDIIAENLAIKEAKAKVLEEEKKPIPVEPPKAVLPVYSEMPIEKAKENKYYNEVFNCKSAKLDLSSIHIFIIVEGKGLTDDDAKAIAVALKINTTITRLDISIQYRLFL
jgi:chromosome segregation ATPase